jgi:uncharacterized membrane protein YbaN (DUF454 family)
MMTAMRRKQPLGHRWEAAVDRVGPRRGRLIWLACGYVCFGLGFVGMALPVMPTTVFWIVATVCFAKSSPRMYRRIVEWPRIGPIIFDFVEYGVLSARSKTIALSGMGLAAVIVAFSPLGPIALVGALSFVALGALYVATRPVAPVALPLAGGAAAIDRDDGAGDEARSR